MHAIKQWCCECTSFPASVVLLHVAHAQLMHLDCCSWHGEPHKLLHGAPLLHTAVLCLLNACRLNACMPVLLRTMVPLPALWLAVRRLCSCRLQAMGTACSIGPAGQHRLSTSAPVELLPYGLAAHWECAALHRLGRSSGAADRPRLTG